MTQVKFCGLKNIEIIQSAIELGADYIGFVFAPNSQRFIDQPHLEANSKFFIDNPNIKANYLI